MSRCPYQIYVETHSALLVGLLGAVELVPLVAMALLRRRDRRPHRPRPLLLLDQIGLVAAGGRACGGGVRRASPPVAVLYVLGGLLAGFSALQNVVRSAIVPNLVRRELDCAARSRSTSACTS